MGLFRKKKKIEWINPAEYSFKSSFINDECVYDDASLAALCSLVCPSVSPSRKNLNTIIRAVVTLCDTTLRHANKFYAMAMAASDPQEFFDDIFVVRRDMAQIRAVEKFAYYGGLLNEMESYRLEERYQIELRHMIDRAAAAVSASGSPDELAALHLAIFKAHASDMDSQSQKKLASKYKNYMT